MNLFTSLHDALHAVTDQIQSGLKRLRRSSPTTSSSRQELAVQPKPKCLRKRYPWRSRKDSADEQISKDSSQQHLPQLSGLDFSSVDIPEAVTKASFTEAETQHHIQDRNRELSPPTVAESSGYMKVRLPNEIWTQILVHGIWSGDLSFLLAFRSVSRIFNALAHHEVPRRVPTCLKHDEGDVMEFAPQDVRPGSWVAVEQRLSSRPEYNDFLILQFENPGLYSALPLISAASIRRPTSLVIKESPPYGDGLYIAVSINNRIRTRLVRLGLSRSVAPDFVGWNKLEELILECPISIGDAFHLLARTNCCNSLQAATLNIHNSQYDPEPDFSLFMTMTRLETLTLLGPLSAINILVSCSSFPVLRDLTLTVQNSHFGNAGESMYCELLFPWSQLEQLVLRNTHTSLADVYAVLSQCVKVTRIIWGGSLPIGVQPATVSLSSLKQLTLDGRSHDCLVLLVMLKTSSSGIRKLALSRYHPEMKSMFPRDLEELSIHYPVQEEDILLIFGQLKHSLVRGKFAVSALGTALQLIFPARPAPVRMAQLTHLYLQANHPVQPLLSSLIMPMVTQVDVRPLPYHLC